MRTKKMDGIASFAVVNNAQASANATLNVSLFITATFYALNSYQSPVVFTSSHLFCANCSRRGRQVLVAQCVISSRELKAIAILDNIIRQVLSQHNTENSVVEDDRRHHGRPGVDFIFSKWRALAAHEGRTGYEPRSNPENDKTDIILRHSKTPLLLALLIQQY